MGGRFECRMRERDGWSRETRFWSDSGGEQRLAGHLMFFVIGSPGEGRKFKPVDIVCVSHDDGKAGEPVVVLDWERDMDPALTAAPSVFRVLENGEGRAGFLLPDFPDDADEFRRMNRQWGNVTDEEREFLDKGQSLLEQRCQRLAETAFSRASNLPAWIEAQAIDAVASRGLKTARKTGI